MNCQSCDFTKASINCALLYAAPKIILMTGTLSSIRTSDRSGGPSAPADMSTIVSKHVKGMASSFCCTLKMRCFFGSPCGASSSTAINTRSAFGSSKSSSMMVAMVILPCSTSRGPKEVKIGTKESELPSDRVHSFSFFLDLCICDNDRSLRNFWCMPTGKASTRVGYLTGSLGVMTPPFREGLRYYENLPAVSGLRARHISGKCFALSRPTAAARSSL